jgi:Uma2 family endonuclease
MATQPIVDRFVPLEEYLSTVYEHDCEYDEGVVLERNVGDFAHAFLQAILGTLFTNNMEAWGVFGLTEQRVQIKPRKFLVPDVCVLRLGAETPDILTRPPLIAIEIQSPDDTLPQVAKKASEYLQFGVENIWVIDPRKRVAYRATATGLEVSSDGELAVAGTPILVRVAELFEKLDRIRAASGERY